MGEKINATFDFVKANWRVWLRFMLYCLLPVCCLQGMSINNFMESLVNDSGVDDVMVQLLSIGMFVVLGGILLVALNLVLLKLYQDRPGSLEGLTFKELWSHLKHALWRITIVGLVSSLVILPVYLLVCVVMVFVPVVGFLAAYAMALPFLLWPVVYVFEQPVGWSTSLVRSVKMGYQHLVQLAFIGIVMGLLVSILQCIVTLPWGIMLFFKYELFNDVAVVGMLFDVLYRVMTIASCFAVYVACSFMVLSLAFHYGSVAAAKNDASLAVEIDDFENL